MAGLGRPGRRARAHQQAFGFLVRDRRRRRRFKWAIALTTLLVACGMVASVPKARYLGVSAAEHARRLIARALGSPPARSEIDAEWARYRRQGILETRREFERAFPEVEPGNRKLMSYAGNDPQTGLLRWGNFDRTLLLPSTIFEPDDHGRSYRLRPNTRAVWLRNLTVKRIPLTFFLVPDGPDLEAATKGTTAILVDGATQTTNSWGLRGPEPDPAAPLRGIVLGDSFMQGLFVGDRDTPAECLRRSLEASRKSAVSILNTGHLGYSTEQEYFTLVEYGDRFRPHFVILSLFANDFGDVYDVLAGRGDWDEGRHWLQEIARYCSDRNVPLLTVTAPIETQITGRPFMGSYPGGIVNLLDAPGTHHVDATSEFVDSHLRLMEDGERAGRRPQTSPLYNGAIGDHHYSARGSECWARAVTRRLLPLLGQGRNRGAS